MNGRSLVSRSVSAFFVSGALIGFTLPAAAQLTEPPGGPAEIGSQMPPLTQGKALSFAEAISVFFEVDVMDDCLAGTSQLEADVRSELAAVGLEVVEDRGELRGLSNPSLLATLVGRRLGEGEPCVGHSNMYVYVDGQYLIHHDIGIDRFLFDPYPPSSVEHLAGTIVIWSNDFDEIFFGRESLDPHFRDVVMGMLDEFFEEFWAGKADGVGSELPNTLD